MATLNKSTGISLGVVLTIIAFAFSAGCIYMKIENFDTRIASVEVKIDEIYKALNPKFVLTDFKLNNYAKN